MEQALRKEYGAVALLMLATAALVASLIASGYRTPPERAIAPPPPTDDGLTAVPWPTHAAVATSSASHGGDTQLARIESSAGYGDALKPGLLSSVHRLDGAEIEADISRLLARYNSTSPPAAGRTLPLRIDFVSRRPVGPLRPDGNLMTDLQRWLPALTPFAYEPQPLELNVLLPGRPRWTAGAARRKLAKQRIDANNWRLFGWETIRPVQRLGRWWAGYRRPELPKFSFFASAGHWQAGTDEPTITSPRSLGGPRLTDSSERLAMAPRRKSNQPAQLRLRRRESPRQQQLPLRASASGPLPEFGESPIQPTALLNQLHDLASEAATATWARRAESLVQRIVTASAQNEPIASSLDELQAMVDEGLQKADALASEPENAGLAARLRRACHAIDRRAAAWKIAGELRAREASILPIASNAHDRLRERLVAVLAATDATSSSLSEGRPVSIQERGDRWRRYLMTDRLTGLLDAPQKVRIADRRQLAADICRRISSNVLTKHQRQFVETGPIAALGDELFAWGGPPTDTTQTLVSLEQYETSRSPRLAQQIVRDTRVLSASSTALHRKLADQIEQKYRNANLRVAVTSHMLQRYLPSPPPRVDPVHDRIAGALVRGRATTHTSLSVRLLPDPFLWRFGLEARGAVQSRTFANPGPVVMRNRASTTFFGRKLITVEPTGLRSAPAVCSADSRMQLVGLSTDYDNVPLLGSVVRSRALDEQASRRGLARRQSEDRVSTRVRQSLDEQSGPMLSKLQQRYSASVLDRAAALGLRVEPVEMRTTESRLIARMRVAGDRQLAAHTPRNRAPSDSVASLQLHESLINNILSEIGVSGKPRTPAELQQLVQDRLQLPEKPLEAIDKKIKVLFADEEPLRILLNGGRAELVLSIREMVVDRSRYHNFKVHAFYEPVAEGIEAMMARSGGIQIEGRMRAAKRVQLHGVFNQVFHEDRTLPLLKLPAGGEPRLAGLMVTQLVIGDGWLGLAIGPAAGGQRVAEVGRYVR